MRLIAILILAFFGLFSQEVYSKQTSTPKVRIFDENSGYQSTNYISDIKCDRDGLIWIVNFNGISTYNGEQFSVINTSTASHAALLRFYENEKNQRFVIDFLGAIFFIEGDTLRSYAYNKTLKDLKPRKGFSSVQFDNEGNLHVSFNNVGYFVIDSKGEVTYPLKAFQNRFKGQVCILKKDQEPFFTQIIADSITKSNSYFYLLNESLEVLDSHKLEKAKYRYPYSLVSFENSYILSNGKGQLFQFDHSGNIKQLIHDKTITKLLSDEQNGVWLSTADSGVYYFDSLENFTKPSTCLFNSYTATASAIDLDGGVWVYSSEQGLAYIANPHHKYYNIKNGLLPINSVFGIEKVQEKLLISSEGKTVYVIDENKFEVDSIELNIKEKSVVHNIYYDEQKKRYWIACRGALYYGNLWENEWNLLENDQWKNNSGSIFKILGRYEEINALVFALEEQYFLVEDLEVKKVSQKYPNTIYAFEPLGDSILVGTEDGIYIEVNNVISSSFDSIPKLKERVYSINKIGSKAYISQRNIGIYSFPFSNDNLLGMNNEFLQKGAVFKVSDKELLIIAKQGSFVLERRKNRKDTLKLFARLPRIVAGNFVYRNGAIYWGTWYEGVFKTKFKDIVSAEYKPLSLGVSKILIDGKQHNLEKRVFEINYNKGLIQFYYSAVNYQNWEVLYRHRLKGLNNEWTITNERNIQYTTLPAGTYTFQLQGKKGNQYWGNSIEYTFKVLPPFWKEWWFMISTIFLLLLLTYVILRNRIKRIEREKDLVIDRLQAEQRALRAQMDPHFVFNIVSSAQYLVMKEENEKAIDFLSMFSKLMRNILDYSNNNFISLKEEVSFLTNYVELERMRLENAFTFSIDNAQSHFNGILIPPFLIQPFIENAIHHGLKDKDGDKAISLKLKLVKDLLIVIIEDNGIGRKSSSEHMSEAKKARKSHGIRIITERLKLNNNNSNDNVIIEDLYDKEDKALGTKVELRIKVKHEGTNN